MHRPLFLEWLYSACDRPARLRIQSAQREDAFLPSLHVVWRQHFVNNRTADTMTGLQNRFWFLVSKLSPPVAATPPATGKPRSSKERALSPGAKQQRTKSLSRQSEPRSELSGQRGSPSHARERLITPSTERRPGEAPRTAGTAALQHTRPAPWRGASSPFYYGQQRATTTIELTAP